MYVVALVALFLCFLFKVFNINNIPERCVFFCQNKNYLDFILKYAPSLNEPYSPTRVWGYSGHIQTFLLGMISMLRCPLVKGRRYTFVAADGATVTYDLYKRAKAVTSEDITLAVCPGIANSSESVYIRRVVFQARNHGFNISVLNHVGALETVPLTAPRIFNYGNTEDYHGMICDLSKRLPHTKFICIGFSMGGNIITKYLGEAKRDHRILAGVSVCQGYEANETTKQMLLWEGWRRIYFYIMTENMRSILRRWQQQLFPEEIKKKYNIIERQVWSAATLIEIDDVYTRKLLGLGSVEEMYHKVSSCNYWSGIDKPMVFINALDDPIIPPVLLRRVRDATKTHPNFLYIEQKYGGHLGFYEGGTLIPNPLTWLDRTVVDLAVALTGFTCNLAKSDFKFDNSDIEGSDSECNSKRNSLSEDYNLRDLDSTLKHNEENQIMSFNVSTSTPRSPTLCDKIFWNGTGNLVESKATQTEPTFRERCNITFGGS